MKKIKYFIAFFGVISIFLVGCSDKIEKEEQKIKVQNNIGGEIKKEKLIKILDKEQVQKVKEILNDLNWQISKVDMIRPADYRFVFEFKNPNTDEKALLYELWISPNKENVELVISAESKYIQLDKNKSAELFKILTGKELSSIK